MLINKKRNRTNNYGGSVFDIFLIQYGLKQGYALIDFTLEYAIEKVQINKVGLEWNGTHQLLVYAHEVNLLEDNIYHKDRRWGAS
jgi:hypothetical protein